jgi:predicted O-methyltransferase YrrM
LWNRELLESLAQKALNEAPLNNDLFPPSPYYRFLKCLAEERKPQLSVELGVSGGGGSLHLALGNLAGKVVGVDIAPIPKPQLDTITAMVGDTFYFWHGNSCRVAVHVNQWFGDVDILFIDTTHTYEQTMNELNAWKPFLGHDAIVCFDDLLRPEMKGLWEVLPEPKLRLDKLHDGAEKGGGFGVIWHE